MPAPAVDQHERLIGRETAQREGPHDVRGVGDALMRKVHRRRHRLEDLAGFRDPLLGQHFGREDVDRNRELLRSGVAGARTDDDVHRRKADRLFGQHEILHHRDLLDRHARRLRLIAEQARAHEIDARGDAADLVATLVIARGPQAGCVSGDRRAGERCAGRVRDAPANHATLRQHHGRQQ